ncbi:CYFA0S01e12662g1_1 [Cyberlindnera fabianii]|uniref:CYFA0S01e12662g1_1 n=1 Tax=Cyberlindnera fabianii TaxID=36022 RepID=A0A061AQF8_CYBFA|nr:CYFA0S01e12662g1_1 [Cyberlindnera fabianii]
MAEEEETFEIGAPSSIFNIAPVQFQTDVSNIASLSVSSDILVIGFKTGRLFRIDLNNPTVIEELELPHKKSLQELGKIEKLFQDPTGNHLIVSTTKAESFYVHKSSTQFKYINELKNVRVSAVAWNKDAVTDNQTGAILIGDKSGAVHEAFVEYIEASQKCNKKVLKDVYKAQSSIDGLAIGYDNQVNSLTVLIVSGDDIAYWNDTIRKKNVKYNDFILGEIFKTQPVEFEQYQDLGNINGSKFSSNGLDFGWITTAGTVFGRITNEKAASKKNIADLKILVNMELPESSHKFKSIILTKYHLILLRGSELLIINKLNDEVVYHQSLPVSEGERFIGLSADYTSETYWAYSNLSIYEITVDDEDRDIWRAMVENRDFEDALAVARDVETKDVVLAQRGDYLFSQGLFDQAAHAYSATSRSFESVALMFINKNQNDALLEYFLAKFSLLKEDKKFDFKMQLVMLSSWIVELFVERLNELDDILATEQLVHLEETTILKTGTEKRFQEFIIENKDVLDKKTAYEIIASHNRRSELLYYAGLINDYDFVLAYWIRYENWEEALKTLEKNNDANIAYKYSTVLLVNDPIRTVDTWLRMSELNAAKLLPAILTYNKNSKKVKTSKHQGVRFLLSYIEKTSTKDASVHDTLLYILISNESSDNEKMVLRYLEEHGSNFYYNPDFILRLCLRFKKIQSATYIYSILDCYEDALNLAIENDMIDLAIVIADKPDDDKTRKFLWLKVADKKIAAIRPSEKDLIKKEVKFLLDKCELLRVKDLLPRIPDFTSIDNLKEEICNDLENFGTIINKLSHDMNSSITINDSITEQIGKSKKKIQIIKAGTSCSQCELLLTSRKFFVFPCGHSFHSDCLIKEILRSNDYATKKKIEFLQKKFMSSKHEKGAKFVNDPEVDALLSKRCPLCSDIKIDTIDQPFDDLTGDDWDV